MMATRRKVAILSAALALTALRMAQAADEPAPLQHAGQARCCAFAEGWTRLAPSDLLGFRGGLDTSTDVSIALSIERAVGLGPNLGPDSASGQPNLIWLSPALRSAAVQNQLNNQRIQVFTIINSSVTELSVLRSLNLQMAIQDAAARSLRH